MDEYLGTEELCTRIKYSKQTIYNKIYKKELVFGVHYIKPSRKKILFKWKAMQSWLERGVPQEKGVEIKSVEASGSNIELESQHSTPSPSRALTHASPGLIKI